MTKPAPAFVSPSFKHFVTLGVTRFLPPNGRGDSGYAEIDFSFADRDHMAEVLESFPTLQEGDVAIKITAGRAGTWSGIGRLRAGRLVPPDEAGQASTLESKLRIQGELVVLQELMALRLNTSALELENVTLELELQAPPLPLEGGESGEHPGQGHLMDDPPPAGGGKKGRGPRKA